MRLDVAGAFHSPAMSPAVAAWVEALQATTPGAYREHAGLIDRQRCPQDARRTVVRATAAGLAKVKALSETIEAHYAWMERELGKTKLTALYDLLDKVIALEVSDAGAEKNTEE